VTNDIAERVTGVVWANDNRTLFYTQEDEVSKRSWRCCRVRVGETRHDLLYEEPDALYSLWLERPLDGAFVQLNIASKEATEVRVLPADRPQSPFRTLLPRGGKHKYFVTSANGLFYIRTNDRGLNYRLVTAPQATPGPEHWTEVVPHRDDVMLEGMYCFKDFFVVEERRGGVPALRVFPRKGAPRAIGFPEPSFILNPMHNAVFDAKVFRFAYESLVTPYSVYDYDVRTGRQTLLKREEVLGGYDPKAYRAERLWATAPDGVKVPISIVTRRDPAPTGPRPMLLQGYGSYGIPEAPYFSSNRLSLLDRGFAIGLAHVRGGGDLGKAWHEAGKMMAKRNTFTDFIACAEFLVREGITASDRLVISGGSAGGLLMGAVTNMRPDLFKAVVTYVPFVDVMNTMLDATLPLTVEEYLEWGNPNEPEAYAYMKGYSPYDNLEAKAYPAMLVRSSLNDSQVMYWEPAKYVAKLRALKTDANPLLFKIRLDPGGHGGASGRYDRLREAAFDYAFILWQAGAWPEKP
jgi:oligopeptidase B